MIKSEYIHGSGGCKVTVNGPTKECVTELLYLIQGIHLIFDALAYIGHLEEQLEEARRHGA